MSSRGSNQVVYSPNQSYLMLNCNCLECEKYQLRNNILESLLKEKEDSEQDMVKKFFEPSCHIIFVLIELSQTFICGSQIW